MRLRPASLAVLAAAAGICTVLTACGGSGRDPRPGQGSGPPALSASTSPSLSGQGLPAAGSSAAPGQTDPLGSAITVEVAPRAVGAPMPVGFLGFSLEYPTLERYLGTDPAHLDPVFLALIRALNPGQAPIFRIGGDSTDRTWWPVARMRTPTGINFALDRRWASVARSLATDTGGRLILGINLAAGKRRLASVEARRLLGGVGRRHIAALEIGNEPDDYPVTAWYWKHRRRVFARSRRYTVEEYLKQFAVWRATMPHSVALAGPALARTQWLSATLRSELNARRTLGLVTFHRYPLRACETERAASDYPTIARLLSDRSSTGLAAVVAPYVNVAHRAGRRFRLDELNSVSCRGKLGVSNTFASALWMLDTLFNVRSAGVDGVNVHMLPGSAYQAFSVAHSGGRWSASIAPVYYGMLMFAHAFPPGAKLLDVTTPPGAIKVWATQVPGGRLHVVLINQSPVRAVTARLRLPGAQTPLSSQTLLASSLSASAGITLGGRTFGRRTRTGVLPANRGAAQARSVQGYYGVSVPAGSAVLLTR